MPTKPFRAPPKLGRNDPCFCGSNRKFKLCHGGPQYDLPAMAQQQRIESAFAEAMRQFEAHKIRELDRQKQQGLGRPIVTAEFNGYRFVAVGNRLHYGRWKTFPDFLANYIKTTMGGDWGNSEIAKPLEKRHPILQWYDAICRLQANTDQSAGPPYAMPVTGAVSAYYRLAYNLYLIAHNNRDIQTRLIKRLKDPENFQGAFFETQVAAWLTKAGFELEFEDESDRTDTHCEFTATYKTGERYSVEAKSGQLDPDNTKNHKVGRRLMRALAKSARFKRLVFLDLNKPLHSEADAVREFDRAVTIIRRMERQVGSDRPAPAAYVCLSNTNDQYVAGSPEITMMIQFLGFKVPDFMGTAFPSFRAAARARERHLPLFNLLRSMEDHREIPQTFEGEMPSEVLSKDPQPGLTIGRACKVPGPDGNETVGILEDAVVGEGKAHCIFRADRGDQRWIVAIDLTPDELADYRRHPDTYFGVLRKQGGKAKSAMELFDFFVSSYQETPRKRLIELLGEAARQENVDAMTQPELVEFLAERYTMSITAR